MMGCPVACGWHNVCPFSLGSCVLGSCLDCNGCDSPVCVSIFSRCLFGWCDRGSGCVVGGCYWVNEFLFILICHLLLHHSRSGPCVVVYLLSCFRFDFVLRLLVYVDRDRVGACGLHRYCEVEVIILVWLTD